MSDQMLDVATAIRTFPGGRSYNEDLAAVEVVAERYCCVLSDGAGGHSNGALASRTAVDSVVAGFKAAPPAAPDAVAALIVAAHDAVIAAQQTDTGDGHPMHATLVTMIVDRAAGTALWGHVGDSRLYHISHGAVVAVTRDDSVVQWMVDSGYLQQEQAASHPNKNQLLAALGIEGDLEPKVLEQPQPLDDGDAYLLCSDGWWEMLTNTDIEQCLFDARDVGHWLDSMAKLVVDRAKPSHDNFTALAVWIGDPSTTTRISIT
ncbi:protein phosphatase 2C domain-containing protein [soil metagenome]